MSWTAFPTEFGKREKQCSGCCRQSVLKASPPYQFQSERGELPPKSCWFQSQYHDHQPPLFLPQNHGCRVLGGGMPQRPLEAAIRGTPISGSCDAERLTIHISHAGSGGFFRACARNPRGGIRTLTGPCSTIP